MKASIFQSGDFLANYLVESNEQVEDVDFSVCMISFKDDIAYAWIDGNLNIRIYRGDDSLLVNNESKPQFFGSTNVELGDIFSVTYSDLLSEPDANTENYVLENATPSYPTLLLDYQVENKEELDIQPINQIEAREAEMPIMTSFIKDEIEELDESMRTDDLEIDAAQMDEEEYPREEINKFPKINRDTKRVKPKFDFQKIKSSLSNISKSPNTQKVLQSIKSGINKVFGGLMSATSKVSDFIYAVILRRNSHQLKRFQSSNKKKNLQYLLIVILIITPTYLVFFRGKSTTTTPGTKTAVKNSKDNEQIRNSVQTAFQNVQKIYNTDPISVPSFNQSYTTLKQEIEKARSAGFSDTAYLDSTLKEVQTYENKILKVTEITKVDISYNATTIPNAKIVDFSLNGTDVYAIDQTNAQILKSGQGQDFEVFAKDERGADKKLTTMTQITCAENLCYLLDETKGLAVLNLSNKTFSNYSGLGDAGKGVKEMAYFTSIKKIYTFTPSSGKVLRYDKLGDAFTAPTQWNKDTGFGGDISDFAIDGSILELSTSGKLRRFASGINDTQFGGIDESTIKLGSRLQVSSTMSPNPAKTNRLYIADSDNKMIAVYEPVFKEDKSNAILKYNFKGIYKYNGTDGIQFNNFTEIVLSADENALYLLDGNAVHKVTVTGI
jgi:hypothetical protein